MKSVKKVKRYVKCNGIVRQFTYARLRLFTNMSIGEIFDRYIEGKGVITKMDQDTLDLALKLRKLLRKVNISRNVNEEFWSFLQKERERYSADLDNLIKTLELGSPIIHHRDVALTAKMRHEVNEEYVNHLNEQRAFKNALMMLFEKKGFWTGFDTESIYSTNEYSAFVRSYYNKIKKESKDNKEIKQKVFRAIYKDLRWYLFGGRKIIGLSSHEPGKFVEVNTLEEKLVEDAYQSYLLHLRFDDRYTFYTSYPDKLDSNLFRDIVEYIYFIPSISNPEIIWQLTTDINLLEKSFPKWKLTLKKNGKIEPNNYGALLIYKYENIKMKDFKIPSLTCSILDTNTPKCHRILPWWNYKRKMHLLLMTHGMLICGIQGRVEIYLPDEFEQKWNEVEYAIKSFKFSDNEDNKLLFNLYEKYREGFLIPHFFPKVNALLQSECIYQNLWRIRKNKKFKLYNSIFMQFNRSFLMKIPDSTQE